MHSFLKIRKKTGGPKKNSNVKIEVVRGLDDHARLVLEDCGENKFAPLQVRVLQAGEYVTTDFQETKTLSDIVRELGGPTKDLNDVPLDSVLKACRMFSSHSHSVTPDEPVPNNQAVLHDVTVDVDSVTAVFKYRKPDDGKPRTLESIMQALSNGLGEHFTGFNTCTNYCANNDWMKALSSNVKGGPTIEMYDKGDRFRVRLPTPAGLEILKIWVHAHKHTHTHTHTHTRECHSAAPTQGPRVGGTSKGGTVVLPGLPREVPLLPWAVRCVCSNLAAAMMFGSMYVSVIFGTDFV